ncbi:glycoside hydrolase family 43 protein [Echinicola jeungdonensis]|uniref:Glycoside hydrolase family 43 protein n=1 Tax=Echinicola jeungdonensis TaxID=709343 RepID=A0ABV5JA75_9BACT|nr:glycoside hydrolase family 43 protein [Echinicola jeungdonensis]MDN3669496.1 glycoside hydrolase family 43 protein [Echinicola jeungdonensis]
MLFGSGLANGQDAPSAFQNPIMPGFGPDPSICRAGDDYYLVNSSFAWFPGIPIYHSKDLVNWKLIGYGITRPEQLNFDGIKDKNGIWAPTIRYHKGLFYISTTCNNCGGNFYITADDPTGEWSDPVWLPEAPGIDPSLFWDDDGRCYYTGNYWNFKGSWPGHCAIWAQELDLEKQKLVGEMKVLTSGHANNASHTEAPHIYKIDGRYLLGTAEGGTNGYHAVTVHHSDAVLGPYTADKINPVLTHRHFGEDYPVQAVGHADLVQIQNGTWWAVVLGKRQIEGHVPLPRETFLCKVTMENGTPIFNPGQGKVLMEQERPDLPWTPIPTEPHRDEFDSDSLALKWYTVRTPTRKFHTLEKGKLTMELRPQVVDSLENASLLIQPTRHFKFSATTKLTFKPTKENEQAGLIIYRTNESYYTLMKEKGRVVLVKKFDGQKKIVLSDPYNKTEVFFNLEVDSLAMQFQFGESPDNMVNIGEVQSLVTLSENEINKFNGTGIGLYATSKGQKSNNKAIFDWFEYKY